MRAETKSIKAKPIADEAALIVPISALRKPISCRKAAAKPTKAQPPVQYSSCMRLYKRRGDNPSFFALMIQTSFPTLL